MELDRFEPDGEGSCGSAAFIRGVVLLQEKWVMLIVHQLLAGPAGFNELSRKAVGVNVTTLSQRLTLLEHAGILIKTIHSSMPPRTSYALTEAGMALGPVFAQIERWSQTYLPPIEPPHVCPNAAKEAVA